MSFLDSVLSSIETGKPTPIPTTSPAPSPTISSSNVRLEARKSNPVTRPVSVERKNGVPAGTKRKAEEPLPRIQKPLSQISARPTPIRTVNPPTSSNSRPISTNPSKITKPAATSSAPIRRTPPVSSKPPPKGSYAELMARAKAAQQTAPTQVGMLKHQPAPKEKLSKVERKRRLMEARAKEKEAKLGKKAGAPSSATNPTRIDNAKPAPKRDNDEPTYRGTARPPPPQFEYRGTAGLPSRNGDRRDRLKANKRSRMDEYLGTDEEDEGEFEDDYDDYYSESSDMEAGLNDVEAEEAAALAAARREDEEDIRREAAAKQEKLERRKKLAMLASRRQ
ncbi:hypothetical protein BJY04DRAFT_190850 [Aspergillus karnatakaensis]|uniref:uncharacterized protein n=1 Tax=Aspergillus karnatakaensis TaxID=1810916 RepID=UPI003CCD1D16